MCHRAISLAKIALTKTQISVTVAMVDMCSIKQTLLVSLILNAMIMPLANIAPGNTT